MKPTILFWFLTLPLPTALLAFVTGAIGLIRRSKTLVRWCLLLVGPVSLRVWVGALVLVVRAMNRSPFATPFDPTDASHLVPASGVGGIVMLISSSFGLWLVWRDSVRRRSRSSV